MSEKDNNQNKVAVSASSSIDLFDGGEETRSVPCGNCKEIAVQCACMRNICIDCGDSVGNITFTVCDDCWDIRHPKT